MRGCSALFHSVRQSGRFSSAPWLALVLLLGAIGQTVAQEPTGPPLPDDISAPAIQSQIARIEQTTGLDEDVRAKVLENLRQALEQARAADDAAAKIADFQKQTSEAPATREQLEMELSEPPADPVERFRNRDLSLPEWRQQLTQTESDLSQAREEVASLTNEFKRRGEMRIRIPGLIDELNTTLAALAAQPFAPIEGENPELGESRRILWNTSKNAAEKRIQAYQAELANYEARGAVLSLKTDAANRRVTTFERFRKFLSDTIAQKSVEAAVSLLDEAEAQRDASHDAPQSIRKTVERIAQENWSFAGDMTGPDGLVRKTKRVEDEIQRLYETTAKAQSAFDNIRSQEQAVGLTEFLGIALRDQRANLTDPADLARNIRVRTQTLGEVQIDRLRIDQARRDLSVVEDAVDEIVNPVFAANPRISDDEKEAVRAEIVKHLTLRKHILDELQSAYEKYFDRLVDLNTEEKKSLSTVEEIRDYIDKRVLWSQSDTIFLDANHIRNAGKAFAWLVDLRAWLDTLEGLWRGAQRQPGVSAYLVLLVAALIAAQPTVRQRLRDLSVGAAKPSCTSFAPTAQAFVYTFILGGSLAAILAGFAWRFTTSTESADFARALGEGLLAAAAVLFPLEVVRQAARPDGLAESHFGLPATPLRALRKYVFALEFAAVPAVIAIQTLDANMEPSWSESLGRLIFMGLMLGAVVFTQAVFQAPAGPLRRLLETGTLFRGQVLVRWMRAVSIAAFLALAFAAFLGYFYTAAHLGWRLYVTFAYMIVLWLVRALVVRWLLLTRRTIAMEQARQRREAQKAKKGEGEVDPTESQIVAEAHLDLARVDQQSMRLLRTALTFVFVLGLWFVWVDVLPALSILEDVHISVFGLPILSEITYAQLGLAFLILFITTVAVRNLPGILEITVLQRLHVGAGERNAISTIFRYCITILGGVIAFNIVGIGWEKVQWLVAALSLGLGFGLQEIFANFVSGIIILLERPVRVGDTITVGNINGTVTRIRIRATTITDWDNKELIVPNKEFVTGQLVNWTLTDSNIRLIVPVGVAYGSNTEKVVETLLRVAAANDRILKEPAPAALFLSFGDSTLNFELRVFCPSLDYYLKARHDLHMVIDKAFREQGIEIAFPQRDVHVRSIRDVLPIEERAAVDHVEERAKDA